MNDTQSEKQALADQMKMEMAYQMVSKIEGLKAIKTKVLDNKRKELAKTEQKYRAEIAKIEKDIYSVENAIKQVVGTKGLAAAKRIRRDELNVERRMKSQPKTINTDEESDDTNNNDNKNVGR